MREVRTATLLFCPTEQETEIKMKLPEATFLHGCEFSRNLAIDIVTLNPKNVNKKGNFSDDPRSNEISTHQIVVPLGVELRVFQNGEKIFNNSFPSTHRNDTSVIPTILKTTGESLLN